MLIKNKNKGNFIIQYPLLELPLLKKCRQLQKLFLKQELNIGKPDINMKPLNRLIVLIRIIQGQSGVNINLLLIAMRNIIVY